MDVIQFVKQPELLLNLISAKLEVFKREVRFGYIFGSLAKGNFLINSDVDLLIVSDSKVEAKIRLVLDELLTDNGIKYDLIYLNGKDFEDQKELTVLKEAVRGFKLWEKKKID